MFLSSFLSLFLFYRFFSGFDFTSAILEFLNLGYWRIFYFLFFQFFGFLVSKMCVQVGFCSMCELFWISMCDVFCLVGEKMWENGINRGAKLRSFNYWGSILGGPITWVV